ncbi:MAG TPA: proton-conducting transporter membrane subunit [Bdellovibrionota bacterium]|nr:proton-conducting transporter membrane subunit [Bdellovibrionota bacterium]
MNFPLVSLILIPGLAALAILFIRSVRIQLIGLLTIASFHLLLTMVLGLNLPVEELGSFLKLDSLGYLFLILTSALFVATSFYSLHYLQGRTHDTPSALHRFVPCLLGFLSMMTLVIVSHHLALMWAAIEATTLASAPLIYFYRRKPALEATWKYLMICSVGIALALLGTFAIGIARSAIAGEEGGFFLSSLQQHAAQFSKPWLKVAFILALVGYGTKMGLAPLHTWLPDAHSQAPSPVSALLSGALLNCAFLGILRFYQICVAAGEAAFAQELLLMMGIVSLVVATAFILGQRDYKRLFAYSSVENMGILAVGVGVGGAATYGAMLHAVNHSLAKAGLFFLAGNILNAFGTTDAMKVRGVFQRVPVTGILLIAGLFAIGGSPPFGLFVSEFTIFQAAINFHVWFGVLFLALLSIAFLGMAGVIVPMVQGEPPAETVRMRVAGTRIFAVVAPLVLLSIVLVLGLYIPPFFRELLEEAAHLVGAQ